MRPPSYKKRKLLNMAIKRKMQLRILSSIFLIVLVSLMVSGGIFYHYSNKKINSTYKQFHVQLYNMKQVLVPWILFAVSLGAIMALAMGIFYPGKIAGPLYRLEKRLRELASGNFKDKVKLRSNDELQDLAEEINQMAAKLQEKLLLAKNRLTSLDSIINNELSHNNSEDTIYRLQKESAHLKEIFDEFIL